MRAYLITPDKQSIDEVEVTGLDDVKALIGFDTLESDAIGSEGDRLYFDEECFLRGASGRFQIDTVIPVSGKGVVVGTAEDGATLRDVVAEAKRELERVATRRMPRVEVCPAKVPPSEALADCTFDLRRLPTQDD